MILSVLKTLRFPVSNLTGLSVNRAEIALMDIIPFFAPSFWRAVP
jgi:hypothetical protein